MAGKNIKKTKVAPKTKVKNWYRLKEQRLQEENQKLLVKAKDRLRKYNQRYGTNYKISVDVNLKDPDLHTTLEKITTKNIKVKSKEIENLIKEVQGVEVNGINLTKEEYKTMRELERKANRLRGPRDDGSKYYKPYFASKEGYKRYIKELESRSTMKGYLEGIKRGLQTFKENIIDHLNDLIDAETDIDRYNELIELKNWVENNVNTYSRLDRLYKLFMKYGYTAEQMARIFFDSYKPNRKFLHGEDVTFINILNIAKTGKGTVTRRKEDSTTGKVTTVTETVTPKGYGWKTPQKIKAGSLEDLYPLSI